MRAISIGWPARFSGFSWPIFLSLPRVDYEAKFRWLAALETEQ